MRSMLKLIGVTILCGMTAACSGATQKSDPSGTMSLTIPANYSEDTEAYLKEPRGGAGSGVKRLMFIKNKENSTFCRFNEITYTPQDAEFKSTPQIVSAGFADTFSRALSQSSGAKPAGVSVLTSMKLPIADYDTWLGALRFNMQQSSIVQYFMDSHTLAIQVPGSTAQGKKFVVGECRSMGYPGELAATTNDLVAMYQSIKLSGGK